MTSDPDNRSVLLDACMLVPIRLTMTLLWLAEAGVYEPLWSEQILAEVEINLQRKLGLPPTKARSRVLQMRQGFDAALVEDFDDLIPQMTCDAKDRHVLAAAVRAGAGALVTSNLRDFPDDSTAGHNIIVQHPDIFLTRLLMEQRSAVLTALQDGVAQLRKPPMTTRDWLASLTHIVPIFANQAADALTEPDEQVSPVPAIVAAGEDEALTAYGDPGDLTNPAQVGMLWWTGLLNNLDQAGALTYDERAWGDFGWAKNLIDGRALASKVIPAVDAPYLIAFMRFVPEPSSVVQVFQAFATPATVLVLVRTDDGTWRVWGLGPNMPAARDVVGEELAHLAQFEPGGGTAMVFDWLERLAELNPPVHVIWDHLDDPLRLAFAQDWLLRTDIVTADAPDRDVQAEQLAGRDSLHPSFGTFYADLLAWLKYVYADIDGKPALVGHTETVGVGLELIAFTNDEVAESYEGNGPFPAHTFITRHIGHGEWLIAANARRLPVPGWPPSERSIPGLQIDGESG